MEPVSTTTERAPVDPQIARLREGGWTMEAIAQAIGASVRQVYRWSSGDSRPLPIYRRMLASLPSERAAAA